MLPLYGRALCSPTFVDIIKYILKSFINGGRRKQNVWFIFSTRVLEVYEMSFNHGSELIFGIMSIVFYFIGNLWELSLSWGLNVTRVTK